jgi:hypothetical protein
MAGIQSVVLALLSRRWRRRWNEKATNRNSFAVGKSIFCWFKSGPHCCLEGGFFSGGWLNCWSGGTNTLRRFPSFSIEIFWWWIKIIHPCIIQQDMWQKISRHNRRHRTDSCLSTVGGMYVAQIFSAICHRAVCLCVYMPVTVAVGCCLEVNKSPNNPSHTHTQTHPLSLSLSRSVSLVTRPHAGSE